MVKFPGRRSQPSANDELPEMILLTLARASENSNPLSSLDLARELNLSRGEFESHIRLLDEQGFVHTIGSGTIALTDSGRVKALGLLRRHRLTERLFTDVLGLDWARAHEEADRLEHILSPEAELELATQLGEPDTCPHGNPIPNQVYDTPQPHTLSLAQCTAPMQVSISRIALETPATLQHLATLGLLPNVQVQIENKAPFDGPVMVRVGQAHYALGHDLAARIWVQPVP